MFISSINVDPHACMLCCLHGTEHSDSPLVQHLLTSRWSAWQPSCCNTHTCEQALVGLETMIYRTAASQGDPRQMLYQLSNASLACEIKTFSYGDLCYGTLEFKFVRLVLW